ncbi:MAG: high-potential iron-sulfur protein [Candidatus Eremiobacteraeota bacterium]|nr:high-potential iron-sulfur protein [Candidatus Eremiobacteraeota bacterium]
MKRSDLLKSMIVLPALAAGLASATTPADAAKAAKSALKYQDHPNGKQECDGCKFFMKGKSATADGACKIVAGAISPKGWCTAYSA